MSYIVKEYKMIPNISIGDDEETQIKIERDDGMVFIVNVPEFCWNLDEGSPIPYGLNLVFGKGDHYL